MYFYTMAKLNKKIKPNNTPPVKVLPNDTPLHLNMSFEDAIDLALNTPIKNSKIHKKPNP